MLLNQYLRYWFPVFTYEPHHEKTNNLHNVKTKKQVSFGVTAKLICVFVFATRKVQSLFFLNPKFQASSHLMCLYSLVCVGPVKKPHCLFSHEAALVTATSFSSYHVMPVLCVNLSTSS